MQKDNMTTIKQRSNDLIAMETQGLIKKSGYTYNRAGDPELALRDARWKRQVLGV